MQLPPRPVCHPAYARHAASRLKVQLPDLHGNMPVKLLFFPIGSMQFMAKNECDGEDGKSAVLRPLEYRGIKQGGGVASESALGKGFGGNFLWASGVQCIKRREE